MMAHPETDHAATGQPTPGTDDPCAEPNPHSCPSTPEWTAIAKLDPGFSAAWHGLYRDRHRTDGLSVKDRELLGLAVSACTTLLHLPSVRTRTRAALAAGATAAELIEVLELVSMMGIHAITEGIPILHAELTDSGQPMPAINSTRNGQLKSDFIREKSYWSPFWDALLDLDPDFFEDWTKFSLAPIRRGPLSEAMVHLIYVATDVAVTHLYTPGARIHIRAALQSGATRSQILETIYVASEVGVYAMTTAAPLLVAALDEEQERPDSEPDPRTECA